MLGLASAIAINLLVGIVVLQLAYDSTRDYVPVDGPVQCLKLDSTVRTLCAQCIARPTTIHPDKGVFLDNKHPIGVLELPSKAPLSCA